MKTLRILLEEKGMLSSSDYIINKLKLIEGIQIYGRTFSEEEINSAQQKLQLKFPQDYINILLKLGSFKLYDLEFTSLNNDRNNVINLTNNYKQLDDHFPLDCFVLEDFNNGMITLSNSNGTCFEYINYNNQKSLRKISDTIEDYIYFRLNEEINIDNNI